MMMPRIVGLLMFSSLYFYCYGSHEDSLEEFYGEINCEKFGYFRCDDGECITHSFKCDKVEDCSDGSDEKDCKNSTNSYPSYITCARDEFKCKNKICIPEGKFCDTVKDCSDGSDEYDGCVNELKCDDKFRCQDKHCIRKDWVCDSRKDCPDGSDEINCDNKTLSANDCKNAYDRFLCLNERCISLNAVCNGKDDCDDGSDEGPRCKESCTLLNCSDSCKQTPDGPKCICKPGYTIQDRITCIDIDECQIYGICDQGCVNTVGSYKCTCETSYFMQDDMKTCKATTNNGGEATLMFSITTEIRAMYLDSKMYFTAAKNLSYVSSIAVNGNYVYCSNRFKDFQTIVASTIIGGKQEAIVTQGLNLVSGIAVDWITGNIYFTDEGNKHIGICNANGTYCTILMSEQSKPQGIVLLPIKGIMFWCDMGFPHIKIAGMDGKNSSSFITDNLEWPVSLTIDSPNNRLYWLDKKRNVIESIRLDGTDRRVVLDDIIQSPYSLAVFENKLYWSDWHENTIQSCDKFTGKDWKIITHTSTIPYDIHIDHSAIKPKIPNPCHPNPCSQLCMLNRDKGYTCGCTIDKELKADNHTCREVKKEQHLIIIMGNTFIDYFHNFLGRPKMTTSTTSRFITAATYDSLTGTIIASDKYTNHIIRYDPNSGITENLIPFKNEILGGMAFDYIGNNLYLSNKEDKTIEVHSLTTKTKTVFYFEDQPHNIALAPEEGIMFIVFHVKYSGIFLQPYRLEKMKMNGIGPRNLINALRYTRDGKILLHYDTAKKTLFLAEFGDIKSYQAENRYLVHSGFFLPESITTAGDDIFWTRRESNVLYSINYKNNNRFFNHVALRMPISTETPLVVGLHNIVTHKEYGCQKNNGNCSHVCLPSSALFICACPPGMMLSANNRTCSLQSACRTDEIKCSEHDICINQHQWCDGIMDCPNGEDEASYCGESGICEKDQFMCKDGTCISSMDRCNSKYECSDKSDEEDCPVLQCHSDEFQCRDGTCISNSLECDGHNDCLDFSDEINNHCNERTCSPNKFMCKDVRTCIPKEWECDGERDCSDGSDELGECSVNICGDGKLKCNNGRCISSSLKCNGIDDCGDKSDEKYCLNEKSINCTDDKYLCLNTDICLPKKVRCNGVQDCPKNDDEHHCTYCLKDEFACDNEKKCIPQSWVCDQTDDCGDKSDEKDCDGSKWRKVNVNTSNICEEFKCAMGICLSFDKVCDGIRDCLDGSDENGLCTSSCSHNNVCKDICYKTPLGGVCGCQTGYRLAADTKSCDDINECELDVCSQICRNIVGSFQCSCHNGYVIRSDRVSCKAIGSPMELITVTDDNIRKISSNLLSVEVIHSLMGLNVIGFDVNALDDAIYWSNDEAINKLNIKTNELSVFTNIGNPGVLAVDWITNNIYFNYNTHPNMIKVCNLKQQKCATVVKIEGVAKVTSLIIDSKNRWLFWSQTTWQVHDKPFSEICRSDMMGANMKIIGFRDIGVVSGMAIDHMKSRLYWSDSFHKTIESSNLDGSQRSTFLNTNIHQPLDISIFENSIYWLMGSNSQIQKCKLYANRSCEIMDIGSSNIHKYFAILHVSRHPLVENLCEKQNCDYMCILKTNDAVCICQDGKPTTSNNICTVHDKMRVAARHISRIQYQGGIYIITIIILVIVLSLCAYYYQKIKSQSRRNDLNIRFHNPSYDRRDEVAVILSSTIPNVSPGEHEYINPINDNLLKAAMESSVKRSERNLYQLEKEDEEIEKRNACLISLTHSK